MEQRAAIIQRARAGRDHRPFASPKLGSRRSALPPVTARKRSRVGATRAREIYLLINQTQPDAYYRIVDAGSVASGEGSPAK